MLADLVAVIHLAFIAFIVAGGFLVLRWPAVAWLHVPSVLYGAVIELVGFTCPLTPLEIWLRRRAGGEGYEGGFIEHYITPLIYPPGLTRGIQLALGAGVLILNAAVYAFVIARWRR